MDFWKVSVKLAGGEVLELVGERQNVREFLVWCAGRVECGVVWVKNGVLCVGELENWGFEDISYVCYRVGGGKLKWEVWKKQFRLFDDV